MSDSPFLVWISNYGQIILFFAQLLFWIAVGVAAVWATLLFRRLVNAKTAGVAAPVAASPAAAPKEAEPTSAPAAVSVDEFVD